MGRHTIADGEDRRVSIDRDGEHFHLVLNFLRDCGSNAAADAIRALPDAQLCEVRSELDYYGLDGAVFGGWFSLERASFVPGPVMGTVHAWCSAVVLPGDRQALVIGGYGEEDTERMTAVLDLGTMVFTTTGVAVGTPRNGCAAVVLPGGSRALFVGGHSGSSVLSSTAAQHRHDDVRAGAANALASNLLRSCRAPCSQGQDSSLVVSPVTLRASPQRRCSTLGR